MDQDVLSSTPDGNRIFSSCPRHNYVLPSNFFTKREVKGVVHSDPILQKIWADIFTPHWWPIREVKNGHVTHVIGHIPAYSKILL